MRLLMLVTLAAVALGAAGCRSNNENKTARTAPTLTPTPMATAAALAAPPTREPTAAPTPEPVVPAPTPTPEPVPVAEPVRLRIPKINVDARVIPVGVTPTGEMDTPKDAWSVAWYAPGFKAGEPGNAVMAGHVDYVRIGAAVFWNLRLLVPGDRVTVVAADERVFEFEVKEVQNYTPSTAPLDRIFGPTGRPGLNLVTCNGVFDPRTHEYDQRLVVYTEAVATP